MMVQFLKQSTSADVILGPFVDSTDGVTAETALTISQADIRLSKNGAAFAQTNNSTGATHRENGHYLIPLDSTDTNTLGRLRVAVAESGALPCWLDLHIVPANVWDSIVGGTDTLNADVTQFGGSNLTASGGRPEVNTSHIAGSAVSTSSAQIGVNVIQISGDSVAADNAEAFFDGTGYAGTNNVIPTVTAVTTVNGLAANVITAAATASDFVAAIADGVWDEVLSGHLTAGSTGNALNAAGSAGDPWTTTLPGSYTGSQAGKMLSDILTDTAEIGSGGAGLTALASAANLATVDSVVDAILVDTAEIGTAGAGLTALASAANLAVVDGIVDAILLDTAEIGAAGAGLTALGDTRLANLDAAVSTRSTLTAAQVWDLADGIESGLTPRQALRLDTAALCGKLSGAATTTVAIRNVGDTKTRITATVDADGNRSAVTTDGT